MLFLTLLDLRSCLSVITTLRRCVLRRIKGLLTARILRGLLMTNVIVRARAYVINGGTRPMNVILLVRAYLLRRGLLRLLRINDVCLLLCLFCALRRVNSNNVDLLQVRTNVNNGTSSKYLIIRVTRRTRNNSYVMDYARLLASNTRVLRLRRSKNCVYRCRVLRER